MPRSRPPAGLVMAGLPGMALDPFVEDLIAQGIAGFIYFARNVESPAQLACLSATLQGRAAAYGHPPLLIAVDHEGGRVQRLQQGFTALPPAMAFGAAGDPQSTYAAARVAGNELRACGVNVNLAPCADVNSDPRNPVIGTRSYGSQPEAVAAHVTACIRGLQDEGVLAVAKHFPGHGATHQDSHYDLPRIDRTPAQLEACELLPFRAAVAAGAAGVMSAHVAVPDLTGEFPATLSPSALGVLLREGLGHRGFVLTDCMEMAVIAGRYGPEEATQLAVLAGADLVLWSHTPSRQAAAIAGIAALGESAEAAGDNAALSHLAAAHARVNAARESLRPGRRGTGIGALPRGETPAVGWEGTHAAWREVVSTVPGRAVTLVRAVRGLPLKSPGPLVVVAAGGDRAWPHGAAAAALSAAKSFGAGGYDATAVPETGVPADAAAVECRVRARAAEGATLVCLTRDAVIDDSQAGQAARLLEAGGPGSILIATGVPYDAERIAGAGLALATYDGSAAALSRAAEILGGTARAEGRFP